jgi:replicative DNA helicase
MPIDEQAFRFLTSASKVDSDRLWMGQITPEDQRAISAASRRLKKVGADLIDTDDVTASDILADIEQADYDVVMLDYLQLLDEPQGKSETREMVVSRISRRLKKLAKKKGITILSGSQLNDDGRLRESRAIGQDADKVMRIARFVDKNNREHDDRRKLEFLKNRGGKRNIVLPMLFQGQFYKFREDPEPAAISG